MPSLKIEDDVDIRPRVKARNVPNPQQIYPEIKNLITERLHIPAEYIDEKVYDHDKLGEKETIRSVIEVSKWEDKFSRIKYKLKIDITAKPVRREEVKYVGDVDVSMSAKVVTEYPQETPLQKSMIWHTFRSFYEKTVYRDVKEGYKMEAQEDLQTLKEEIQNFFNLLPERD